MNIKHETLILFLIQIIILVSSYQNQTDKNNETRLDNHIIANHSFEQDNSTSLIPCGRSSCDADPDLIDLVGIFVDNAYALFKENQPCQIGQYVKNNIERYTGTDGWVVLVGLNKLMSSPLEFGSMYKHLANSMVSFTYKNKHDIKVFRARANYAVPYDLEPAGELDFRTLARSLPIIDSDMEVKRQMNFHIVVNTVFNDKTATFTEAAAEMYNGVSGKVCSGEWVFIVGLRNTISNSERFCAAYDRHDNSYFFAAWKPSGSEQLVSEVMAFAPKTNQFCTKTSNFIKQSSCK